MNELPKYDRHGEEVARIREIVTRHALPDFVTRFDIRLGEFDGDPAFWIDIRTTEEPRWNSAELKARADEIVAFESRLQDDLLAEISDRYPFFRIVSDRKAGSANL